MLWFNLIIEILYSLKTFPYSNISAQILKPNTYNFWISYIIISLQFCHNKECIVFCIKFSFLVSTISFIFQYKILC